MIHAGARLHLADLVHAGDRGGGDGWGQVNRLLREPLLHFLLLGAGLFALHGWIGGRSTLRRGRDRDQRRARSRNLAAGFARLRQRPPTQAELDGLIDEAIREEIFYREALALGLDEDDIDRAPPPDAEARVRVRGHRAGAGADRRAAAGVPAMRIRSAFRRRVATASTRCTSTRSAAAMRWNADAQALLAQLRAAGERCGHRRTRRSLPARRALRRHARRGRSRAPVRQGVRNRRCTTLPVGAWQGPVTSGYGAAPGAAAPARRRCVGRARRGARRRCVASGSTRSASRPTTASTPTCASATTSRIEQPRQGGVVRTRPRNAAMIRRLLVAAAAGAAGCAGRRRTSRARPTCSCARSTRRPTTCCGRYRRSAKTGAWRWMSNSRRTRTRRRPRAIGLRQQRLPAGWRVRRAGGLDGSRIRIDGLQATLTDVLVRVETQRRHHADHARVAGVAGVRDPVTPGRWDVARPTWGSASSTSCSASTTCCSCWRW